MSSSVRSRAHASTCGLPIISSVIAPDSRGRPPSARSRSRGLCLAGRRKNLHPCLLPFAARPLEREMDLTSRLRRRELARIAVSFRLGSVTGPAAVLEVGLGTGAVGGARLDVI